MRIKILNDTYLGIIYRSLFKIHGHYYYNSIIIAHILILFDFTKSIVLLVSPICINISCVQKSSLQVLPEALHNLIMHSYK